MSETITDETSKLPSPPEMTMRSSEFPVTPLFETVMFTLVPDGPAGSCAEFCTCREAGADTKYEVGIADAVVLERVMSAALVVERSMLLADTPVNAVTLASRPGTTIS